MNNTHELKTWDKFWVEVRNGNKRFELRYNDRDFQVGDTLILARVSNESPHEMLDSLARTCHEAFEAGATRFQQAKIYAEVSYVASGLHPDAHTNFPGLQPLWCIMSLANVKYLPELGEAE